MQIIRRVVAKISIDTAWLGRIGNFSEPFRFQEGEEGERKRRDARFRTMANFSKVQDLTDRTIHEYTRGGYRR